MANRVDSPVTVYFASLGCPKNRVDTEVMLGLADAVDHRHVAEPEAAEVIVINTCGFIDAAKAESIDTILELAEYKQRGQCRRLIVTGCLVQRHADELVGEIPEIDWLLGAADFASIAGAISAPEATGRQVATTPTYLYDHDTPRRYSGAAHSVYVKVAEGCDRPCAFCIIPKLRGPQRSRTLSSVVAEVGQAAAAGAREINLIAQDLTRYGTDLGEPRPDLATLLGAVAAVDGIDWVRINYTFPTAFDAALISTIANEPKVVNYIDVPLQHIDDGVLKRMRRGHTGARARALVAELRARIPGLVLRTTFLVGHPGESEAAFENLHDFVVASEFERVGVFTFSREPGTVAAMLPDRVDEELAELRRDRLMTVQQEISRSKNQALVGRELDILVDGVSADSELVMQGRWYGQAPEIDGCVYLGACRAGDMVRARVSEATDYDLAAEIIDREDE